VIGRTLALYFAGRFLRTVILIFLLFVLLFAAVRYFELIRYALSADNFDAQSAALAVLLRLPVESEDVLPFAVLFGSIAAFVTANRRLEVVVARAAGLSAWQFLLPAALIGLLLGLALTTVYSPVAAALVAKANALKATSYLDFGQLMGEKTGTNWIRQTGGDREAIIGAGGSFDGGLGLRDVTAFVFDRTGRFIERVDAPTAEFADKAWLFNDAIVTATDQLPKKSDVYRLESSLSPEQVGQTFEVPQNISFWALQGMIDGARRAGLSSVRYELRYHELLSMPILLLAMVLIAATVSLRFSRSVNIGRMVLSGIAVGFMLYVIASISRDMGSGGVVPPPLAAWLPAIVATLFGVTVLLHLEDG
jgi:lipopolysaccharide export system permease protein